MTVKIGCFSEVVVATDSEQILASIQGFGGKAVMTSAQHRSGTERVAEVASSYTSETIVDIQGDEPLLDQDAVRELLERFGEEKEAVVGTLKYPIHNLSDFMNENIVKVVTDLREYALYFSRSPIPHMMDSLRSVNVDSPEVVCYKHIGVYVFRRDFLLKYPTLPQTRLERVERLEQLRVLEHGYRILVRTAGKDSVGVDTEEDLELVREIFRHNEAIKEIHD